MENNMALWNAKKSIKYEGFEQSIIRAKINLTVTIVGLQVGARSGATKAHPNFLKLVGLS